jgi:hypothetical protein
MSLLDKIQSNGAYSMTTSASSFMTTTLTTSQSVAVLSTSCFLTKSLASTIQTASERDFPSRNIITSQASAHVNDENGMAGPLVLVVENASFLDWHVSEEGWDWE